MGLIETPESLHERDWQENKPDDAAFDFRGRFQTLMGYIHKHQPDRVFDIGCGSGFLGRYIKKWKPEIVLHGCDISNAAIERARLHFDKVWKTNLNREAIPAESAAYDVVICSEVLEHIYDVDYVLGEVSRLLKPNGIGLLTVPNLAYWRFRLEILRGCLPIVARDIRHLHQFTHDSFAEKVLKAGMATLSVKGWRVRLPWLADWKPSLLSETLVFEVKTGASPEKE